MDYNLRIYSLKLISIIIINYNLIMLKKLLSNEREYLSN